MVAICRHRRQRAVVPPHEMPHERRRADAPSGVAILVLDVDSRCAPRSSRQLPSRSFCRAPIARAVAIWSFVVSSGSSFASDWVKACMLGTGSLRTRIASPSMSRAGGLAAITPPMTSFSTSISGSHGSSGNGARICGRGSCRRAAWRARAALAFCAACCCCAALSAASIARRPTPESFFASCRSSASSTASRSAPAASRAKVATTSSFAAFSIALRTLAASCLSS